VRRPTSFSPAHAARLALLGGALASCGPALPDPAVEAEKLRVSAAEALGSNAKACTVQRRVTEPDLFGWDSGSRGKVKATAEQGLVIVHFEEHGCDVAISVLSCTTNKVGYKYTPRHAQQSRIAENDADLYAHFPVAVADLRARIGASRGIRADYREEGIDMIPIGTSIAPSDLKGSECAAATHVVSAIHRGAFAVASAALSELRAGGTLFDTGLKQRLQVFDGDGFSEACEGAKTRGTRATGCDEPLRIELQAIVPDRISEAPAAEPPPAPVAAATQVEVVIASPPTEATPRPRAPVTMRKTTRPPAPEPVALLEPLRGGPCPLGMTEIPGTTFTMGADNLFADEGPPHRVSVATYCLDVDLVTVAAYARCESCRAPDRGKLCNRPGTGKDDHPQNCVSWDDATVYCALRSKRLPTEEEWERAARGPLARSRWPWGEDSPTSETACWDRWSADGVGTCAVDAFQARAFGLRDMGGNVWEWVANWYGPYGRPSAANTPRPNLTAGRALRGGAWSSVNPLNLRVTARSFAWPANRDDHLGFRCAGPR
jgi:formylglycine-generating enzyme required for sulfatase activity